jgi:hypothetical protein
MASDAIYNPIEQRTRAQRIPQSMELASIKKDLQNSLKVSNELLEESSTVKYISNLKETTNSTPRAAIKKVEKVHNFMPNAAQSSPKAQKLSERQIKYLGLIIEKDEE